MMQLSSITERGTFSSANAARLLDDPTLQDQVIESVVKTLEKKRYEGVDVDFEYVEAKYADAYLPMHEILHADEAEDKTVYAADGVHPTEDGACLIAQKYLEAISPLVEELAEIL